MRYAEFAYDVLLEGIDSMDHTVNDSEILNPSGLRHTFGRKFMRGVAKLRRGMRNIKRNMFISKDDKAKHREFVKKETTASTTPEVVHTEAPIVATEKKPVGKIQKTGSFKKGLVRLGQAAMRHPGASATVGGGLLAAGYIGSKLMNRRSDEYDTNKRGNRR